MTTAFQRNAFQWTTHKAFQIDAPAVTGGSGAGGVSAWRQHYRDKLGKKKVKPKKKDLLEELDELIVQLRALPAPLAVPEPIISRAEELDMTDTLDAIEAEVVYLSGLLDDIDEEEAVLLLM